MGIGPRKFSLVLCCVAVAAWGQESPVYRSVVDLTRIKVAVLDEAGDPVRALGPEDFRVRENNREREVQVVLSPDKNPLDVVLLLDFSQSIADTWPQARESAHRFLDALPGDDCVHLLPFNDRIGPGAWGAADDPKLRGVVDSFPLTGTTPLYDALAQAQRVLETRRLRLQDDPILPESASAEPWPASGPCSTETARRAGERRRAIVLLSDGADRASAALYSVVLTMSWHAEVPVFPVAVGIAGISDARWRRHVEHRNLPPRFGTTAVEAAHRRREARLLRAQLAEIARVTGGQMVTEPEIGDGYADVLGLLRSYYVVGYRTDDAVGDGWSDVEVDVEIPGREVVVHAQPGIHRVPAPVRTALETLRRGKELFRRQDYTASLSEFDRAIELAPEVGAPFLGRGLVLEAVDRFSNARDSYLRALEHDPGLPAAHARLAHVALRLGRNDEAWEHAVRGHLAGAGLDDVLSALRQRGEPSFDLSERLAVPVIHVQPPDVPSLPVLLATRPLIDRVAAWLDDSPAYGFAASRTDADAALVLEIDRFESRADGKLHAELRLQLRRLDGEPVAEQSVGLGRLDEEQAADRVVEAADRLLSRWTAEREKRSTRR